MSQWISIEFECPEHGVFDAIFSRESAPDVEPCPSCERLAPAIVSAPRIKRPLVLDVHRGKSDEQPTPLYMDTEPLADGMDPAEFQAKRAKVWEDHREQQIKKGVS